MASDEAPHGWIVDLDGNKRPLPPPNPKSKAHWLIKMHAERVMREGPDKDALYFCFPGGILSPYPEWPTREELIVDRMKIGGRLIREKKEDGSFVWSQEMKLTREQAEQAIDDFYADCPEARSPAESLQQQPDDRPAA